MNAGWSAAVDSGCDEFAITGPGYTVIDGVVYLSGDMSSSGSPNGTFATLPQAARPTHALYLTLNEGPADPAYLEIAPNGNMTVFASGADRKPVSLGAGVRAHNRQSRNGALPGDFY